MKRTVGILSGVLAFAAIMFGACLLLTAIGWPLSTARLQTLIAESRQFPAVLFLVLSALIFMTVGALILYGMIGNHFNRRTSALLETNALGETQVSFTALAQIAERVLKNRSDVKTFKAKVYAVGNSIRIDVRAVTAPTVSLLEMTHALQNEIRSEIYEICGTEVGCVNVTVDQADLPPKRI